MTKALTTAAAQDTLGRPAPARRIVAALLHINFGTDTQPPTALWACGCGFRTQTVTGHRAVAEFTATVADGAAAHRSVCTTPQEIQ